MPKRSLIAAGLLALAGCTVGPDYRPPAAAMPDRYAGVRGDPAADPATAPAQWWTAFGDPTLDALIARGLANSPDMAIAASRVRQARLGVRAAGAAALPTVNATADATHLEFSENAGFSQIARSFGGGGGASGGSGSGGNQAGGIALPGSGITTFSVGFDASWELDIFGGVRRGVEAARARTEAAEWTRRDAATTLAAEIALAYFALRLDQAQAGIVSDEVTKQRRSLDIAGNIAKVGLVPQLDVTRQRGTLTATEARLQPIRADADVRSHALGILIGDAPESLLAALRPNPALVASPVPVVPAGLPSDLIRRRPDVRAAERQLAAATADIGVAVADLYPRFNLTGIAQLISTALGNLFSGDSLQLTGTGAAQFPVFDGGRRRATIGMRREDREQAYQQWRATVLVALRDVEDALSRLQAERERNATLQSAVRDAVSTTRAVEAQYRTGLTAQDALLNAQANELAQRENLAGSDTQLRVQTAALYKALGGGWEDLPAVPSAAPVR